MPGQVATGTFSSASATPRGLCFRLRFPASPPATAISATLNGLAVERAADPEATGDDVCAEFIAAIRACSVAARVRGSVSRAGRV
jgi:hypothetical protein